MNSVAIVAVVAVVGLVGIVACLLAYLRSIQSTVRSASETWDVQSDAQGIPEQVVVRRG